MTPAALLSTLADRGITLARDGDRLTVSGASALTDDDRAAIRLHKPRLLEMLAYSDEQLSALDELAARLPEPDGQEVREAVLLDGGRGWTLAVPAEELREIEESLTRLREVRRGARPGGVGGVDTRRARREVARGGGGPGLFGVLDAATVGAGQGAELREGGAAQGQGSTEGIDDGAGS